MRIGLHPFRGKVTTLTLAVRSSSKCSIAASRSMKSFLSAPLAVFPNYAAFALDDGFRLGLWSTSAAKDSRLMFLPTLVEGGTLYHVWGE